MASKTNGAVRRVLAGVALLAFGTVAGIAVSARAELHKHEIQFGHVGTVERVRNLEADIAEIKKDVKTLLERE